MSGAKIYKSIVDEEIKGNITEANWCVDLVQYATYKCKIEGLIAAGSFLCPEIIEVDDCILVRQLISGEEKEIIEYIETSKKIETKKEIEMMVNTWSIGDFFTGEYSEGMDDDKVLNQFAMMLCYFWQMRVNELFPDRDIVVETGMELMGEYGLCITMYEK